MHKNKLSFLIFLSFLSLNLQSAEQAIQKVIGHKLQEGFFGFGSDTIEGFAGVLIPSRKVFFKLPNKNPISLATFITSFYATKNPLAKNLNTQELLSIINLFFQGDGTHHILSFFTFEKAYEVTLKDGSQALVLIPENKDPFNA